MNKNILIYIKNNEIGEVLLDSWYKEKMLGLCSDEQDEYMEIYKVTLGDLSAIDWEEMES